MKPLRRQTIRILTEAGETLRYLAASGCRGVAGDPETISILRKWEGIEANPMKESLDDIRRDLGDCRRCKLCEGRTHIVFGEGDAAAKLVFVGEGPGSDEDRQGRPFVGRAGKLLTDIIRAMGLQRESVYICNIIKCRPPRNRNPETDEIRACVPFLERQLDAIRPRFICALGTFAAQTLLETTTPISRLRGRFHEYRGIRLMPTFHPAYLLRNPEKKRAVWEDVQQLMKVYDA